MSDFTGNFWSVYVTVLTLVGIFACLLLLWITARKKVTPSADNTTGHVWDGDLREMNNPMPRWWMWLFVLTIIFALGYLVAYPGLGSYKGELGWTTHGEYSDEVEKANKELAPLYAQFTAKPAEALAGDPAAMAVGERLFMNNCAQCHGSDARGSKGFPNLTDSDWIHGGAPAKLVETITQGRQGNMPPMAAAVGTPDDVKNVAHYVLSLSGSPHDSLRSQLGKAKFTACAACHGMDGKGNQALGAPNLTDDIWLHGWGEQAIVNIVNSGKVNVMPGQAGKLTEAQIHVLSAYVWGLSNKPATLATVRP
ncbi:MAG: cytochrome-c oxidase, cbb3-type subunit III [Polaromonas sp.]|uniref:cytochrome-c oxidase, cbb3-type subunit III n=1 Tax=Polaromonas sp. TaxID=1869339 RepID=UPI00272FE1E0|nr:cytochrome-c oxidase, cbb3-type subunit III [Polaromonas sp.]MDP2452290.1 cytochrome-c oxidase, cbb3-type subunit III [Polaromonas sp.]MDP3245883.1 cytochrome-c oxidase, cbb3-type subunit III [Polaromonas sp.]MDP3755014.1 cytochrome-c oxidase, cbb3-type subunit III [Polaromonas sp.]MDP3826594.1 cytochrome-c oxidase, cbb3-type subunit III [Polaromonas sp.]